MYDPHAPFAEGAANDIRTPELVDAARAAGCHNAELLLPPVDIRRDAPGVVDPRLFRAQYQIGETEILLVTVSRFSESLKGESLRRTIQAVETPVGRFRCGWPVVGDGRLRPELQRLADKTNSHFGDDVVLTLTGALLDPRPAYAAADSVIGMGGSALRAMAFGKPVIIRGESGFVAPFTPETAESFYYQGMYGVGNGMPDDTRLAANIRRLVERPDLLPALGDFSRQFVGKHFALETASARLSELLDGAMRQKPKVHVLVADEIRTAAVWVRERTRLRAWPRRFHTPADGVDRWKCYLRPGSQQHTLCAHADDL